jgi:hypothetical protein
MGGLGRVPLAPAPVVLQKGAILIVSVDSGSPGPKDTPLFAQVSTQLESDTDFWDSTALDRLMTRRLFAGRQTVRAIRFDAQGRAWFSDAISITATQGQTNLVNVALRPGATVRGQIDPSVPRPVANGRVIANVYPQDSPPAAPPVEWHAWAAIKEDGGFELASLPEGNLEIVALCAGFISTNGPEYRYDHRSQGFLLGTNDLSLIIGMEPTARLEVRVTDDKGKPLAGAAVWTSANVNFGEWGCASLAYDCYNTADLLASKPGMGGRRLVPGLQGVTDGSGLALLRNLPAEVQEFSVYHAGFTVPAVETDGVKRRVAHISLKPGTTNRTSIKLEPRDRSPIGHY